MVTKEQEKELRDLLAEGKEVVLDNERKAEELLKYGSYSGEDRIISSHDMEKEIAGTKCAGTVCRTGLSSIDAIADGYEEGELIVISGMQKNGKTTLAQTFSYNMAEKGVRSVWFSFEVSVRNFLKKFPKVPLFYMPRRNVKLVNQMKWIEERIIESQVRFQTEVVFIDHLHYLIPMQQALNTSMLIGSIMRELKRIAIDRKMVIFLLAHTQKLKYDTVPDLADLRDSSFIAQEADAVMIIKRHGLITTDSVKFDNTAGLYYLANRRTGNLGHVELYMNGGLFSEVIKGGEEWEKELEKENSPQY